MKKGNPSIIQYELVNDALGNKVAVFFPDGKFKEWVTATLKTGKVKEIPSENPLITLTETERLTAIITRLPQYAKCRTLAIGDPDFLPFSFLGRGLRCGQAVCRLMSEYLIGELVELLKTRNYIVEEVREIVNILLDTLHLSDTIELDAKDSYSTGEKDAVSNVFATEPLKSAIDTHQNDPVSIPVATGFLVGRNTLLTNAHVFTDPSKIGKLSAEFKYEEDFLESRPKTVLYPLKQILLNHPELDYALVQLETFTEEKRKEYRLAFQDAGDNFGWLPLYEEPNAIAPPVTKEELEKLSFNDLKDSIPDRVRVMGWRGDAVNIIQHPRGRRKEIVLYDSRVKELYRDLLEYVTDVEPGTSGSPIFNAQWQLVALHRSVLLEIDETAEEIKSISCLGTRISSIVSDLKERKNQAGVEEFLQEFVIKQGQTPSRGKIFLFAGRQRHISVHPELEAQWMQSIAEKVTAKFPQKGFEIVSVPIDVAKDMDAIDWINQQGYRAGYVAIDLCMKIAENPDNRGVSVVYVGANAERKSHAEVILNALRPHFGDPALIQGAVSEWKENPNGVDFCRVVKMPSLVLYLGFLTNPKDCELIGNDAQQQKIADGLVKGLVRWANLLSPLPM